MKRKLFVLAMLTIGCGACLAAPIPAVKAAADIPAISPAVQVAPVVVAGIVVAEMAAVAPLLTASIPEEGKAVIRELAFWQKLALELNEYDNDGNKIALMPETALWNDKQALLAAMDGTGYEAAWSAYEQRFQSTMERRANLKKKR